MDLDRFRPPTQAERDAARRALKVGESDLVLGSVARLERVKNHDFVIDVARRLSEEGTDFKILLAGDGSRRRELETLVAEAGLSHLVKFLGLYRDVPGLLAALDGLIMPSHYEGVPVSVIEAQATGLPCLISDAVSREVDLGVGLTSFLPINDPDPWI